MTFTYIGSPAGVNGLVIFPEKGTLVHSRIRGTNLVTKYGPPGGSCVNPKKLSCMDYYTWEKVVKVVSPAIIKMKERNFYCVCLFYYLYI